MPTAEKAKVIEEVKGWYEKSQGIVFADYRGLKVKELQQLRTNLRSKGGELHIVKNTLFRIAAGSDIENIPAEMHNGTTAYAFLYQNESDCAKELFDFAKSSKRLEVKGGYIGGKSIDAAGMEALSKLPPRDVLIAQVIGAIAAPISNLVGVVEALYADPIRVIGAVADKVAEGSPIPAKEEAKAEAPVPTEAPQEETPVADAAPTEEAPVADAAPAEVTLATEETPAEPAAEEAPAAETPESE